MTRALVVNCESIISPHFKATLVVSSLLTKLDITVHHLDCDSLQPSCVAKDSLRPRSWQKEYCSSCQLGFLQAVSNQNIKIVSTTVRLPMLKSTDHGPEELSVKEVVEAAAHLILKKSTLTRENCDHEALAEWRTTFYNLYYDTLKQIDDYNINEVYVFGQYLQSIAACTAAAQRGVKFYIVDIPKSGDHLVNHINFRENTYYANINKFHDFYNKRRCFDEVDLTLLNRTINSLLAKSNVWVYSPTPTGKIDWSSVDTKFDMKCNTKIITAFTSSPDEFLSGQKLNRFSMRFFPNEVEYSPKFCFTSQLMWVSKLNEFCQINNAYHIIVRIHPRAAANERESAESDSLQELLDLCSGLEHVTVIPPKSEVSSYDLMALSDVCTSMWSSALLESALFGVPAISPSQGVITYPPDFDCVYQSASIDDYLLKLKELASKDDDEFSIGLRIFSSAKYFAFTQRLQLGFSIPIDEYSRFDGGSETFSDATISNFGQYRASNYASKFEDPTVCFNREVSRDEIIRSITSTLIDRHVFSNTKMLARITGTRKRSCI